MEDILKRLGNVESDVSDLKSQMSGMQAIVPHLATKADVTDVRTAVAELRGEMKELRGELKSGLSEVRAEMAAGFGSVRAEMAARETAFLKWIIATVVASVGMAFTIAKFVH